MSELSRGLERLVALGFTLLANGCVIDSLDEDVACWTREQTATATLGVGSAPQLQLRLEFSEFALERMEFLTAEVELTSGQGISPPEALVHWEGPDEVIDDERVAFDPPLFNGLSYRHRLKAPPCSTTPCIIVMELAPSSAWQSDVEYPARAELHLQFCTRRVERYPVAGDVLSTLDLKEAE